MATGRRAVSVGGALVAWVALMMASSAVTHAGHVHPPYFLSISFLPVIGSASYELSRDILRLVRVSAKLRDIMAELDLAVAAADLGVWAWDMERDEISATPEARRMLGIGESEPIDLARFMAAVHADDRDHVDQALRSAIRTGDDYRIEFRVARSDEHGHCWIASRGRSEREGDDMPRWMHGVVFDVTARHRAERESHELRDALAHSERVNATSQIGATLAHELSQPLAAILRNAETAVLLLGEAEPELDLLRVIAADIRDDVGRAADVIQRLRSLLARRRLVTREIAVAQLVSGVLALLRTESASRGIKLETDVGSDLPPVRGDAVQLQQVMLNLVMNAMDATQCSPSGSRVVSVGARATDAGGVEVRVTDSGPGIAGDAAGRLFERFFTTKPNGLGLGLPVSRTIVEAHGGSLTAENNAGGGATFRFHLPAASGEPTT